jgi:hypothetical protein
MLHEGRESNFAANNSRTAIGSSQSPDTIMEHWSTHCLAWESIAKQNRILEAAIAEKTAASTGTWLSLLEGHVSLECTPKDMALLTSVKN